jgi:histidine ammonia-lyase
VDVLRAYQEAIVVAHDGAIGPPLPTRVVRAAMFVRIAGLARGGAGTTPAVAETLVAMLDRGVHPIVPTTGSVGASDLMHMTAIGLVATGLGGRAEVGGEVLGGADAMRRAGITPLTMAAKDGLALISANGVSIGHAALVADRAIATVRVADLAVAVSMEAIHGNPSVVDPVVLAAKPVPGQVESGSRIWSFLSGGDRCRPGGPASVQDPLSFRVAPQVHGAFREVVRFMTEAVELELRASDDNPYVSVEERRLISNGNFHPMVVALAADAVRPAAAHVGLLSDRRSSHMWAAIWRDEGLQSVEGLRTVADQGSPLLRYAGATRYTELRAAAAPVTLDVPSLDIGVEDHATNAPFAVLRTDTALDLVDDLVAVELLLAREASRRDPKTGRSGDGVQAGLDALRATIEALGTRPPGDVLHATVRGALPTILAAAENAGR